MAAVTEPTGADGDGAGPGGVARPFARRIRRPPARPFRVMRMVWIASLFVVVLAAVVVYMTQPIGCVRRRDPLVRVDPERLRAHVRALCETMAPRTAAHPENLDRAAEYVRRHLAEAGADASIAPFTAEGREYKNVVARVGPRTAERIVVGAHYDAAEAGIGADDNASGVAGLIELTSALRESPVSTEVELVAYSLEEPPFFRTRSMGSFVHAESLRKEGVAVRAMIALEMIGYFTDSPGSQKFPIGGLSLLYPSRGNFIAVVGCVGQGALVRRVKTAMAESMEVRVRSINATRSVPGVDFSDHLNYWDMGYPAVMVTDTAFFRNPNYHRATDIPKTLDYSRMAEVVEGVHAAVKALASPR